MKNYELVEGDLLESDAKFIAHQTNCIELTAGGLAKALFAKFPHADITLDRQRFKPPIMGQMPGDAELRGDGGENRYVINLYGQWRGGGPTEKDTRYRDLDHPHNRHKHLWKALWEIDKLSDRVLQQGDTIALPYNIGCGIAGGDWDKDYEPLIDRFAKKMQKRGVKVQVVKLPE